MEVELRQEGCLAILRPALALNAAVIDQTRDEWFAWLQNTGTVRNVIVDMQLVDFMDSSGLGLLVAFLKRVTQRGGDLKIAGLQPGVRVVFEITRAYKMFEIFDNTAEAERACA